MHFDRNLSHLPRQQKTLEPVGCISWSFAARFLDGSQLRVSHNSLIEPFMWVLNFVLQAEESLMWEIIHVFYVTTTT